MDLQYHQHKNYSYQFVLAHSAIHRPNSVMLAIRRDVEGNVLEQDMLSIFVFKGLNQVHNLAVAANAVLRKVRHAGVRTDASIKSSHLGVKLKASLSPEPCVKIWLAKSRPLFQTPVSKADQMWTISVANKLELLDLLEGLVALPTKLPTKEVVDIPGDELVRKQSIIEDDAQHDADSVYVQHAAKVFNSTFPCQLLSDAMGLSLTRHAQQLESFRRRYSVAHAKELVACPECDRPMPKVKNVQRCRNCTLATKNPARRATQPARIQLHGPFTLALDVGIINDATGQQGVATYSLPPGKYHSESSQREQLKIFEEQHMPAGFRLMSKREWFNLKFGVCREEGEDGEPQTLELALPGGPEWDACQ